MNKFLSTYLLIFFNFNLFGAVNIYPDKNVKDFSVKFKEGLDALRQQGGGILYIHPGNYPLLSEVHFQEEGKNITISIIGIKSKTGQLPVIYDTSSKKMPHSFFVFQGNIGIANLSVKITNIVLKGNNIPYFKNHPFINKTVYSRAISALNTNTVHISFVTIQNFYGDGIFLSQGMSTFEKKFRVNQPSIKNCKILNTWGWGPVDDSKDAIMMWQVDRPLIENNIIVNDLNVTKHFGRCGIVLEHNTEKAMVRNNTITGYDRNMHLECDFGGHIIQNNKFSQSNNGVTLSYDCGQSEKYKHFFSPIKIINNNFSYNGEANLTPIKQNDFGFVYIYKPSFILEDLQVSGNTFSSNNNQGLKIKSDENAVFRPNKTYILKQKQKNVRISNNTFN